MDSAKLNNLKQCIEKDLSYTFVENKFLIEAFTHKSTGRKNYERYEFLGDAVLRLSISLLLGLELSVIRLVLSKFPKSSFFLDPL